jgi:hypothetical protein
MAGGLNDRLSGTSKLGGGEVTLPPSSMAKDIERLLNVEELG